MRIKKRHTKPKSISVSIAIAAILLLSFIIISKFDTKKSPQKLSETQIDLDSQTVIPDLSYETLFSTLDHVLFENNDLSIYLIKNALGVSELIYLYNDEPQGRDLEDVFFVHIYVKDVTKLIGDATYANVDFKQNPSTTIINGKEYYIFKKDLISSSYKESHIKVEDIAYINTGRFAPEKGRSLDLRKIIPKNTETAQLDSGLDKINITLSRDSYEKIKNKRSAALENGVLISQDNDLVKGFVQLNANPTKKIKLRLKGDWTDHLEHDSKWSFRMIMEGDNTFKGMRKFSIQHPKARNYLWEWLFNKSVKQEGIIGLRYDFAQVKLKVQDSPDANVPMGIMAVEEAFDKILIENNKKREGILLGFDESLLWKDREKQRDLGLEEKTLSQTLHSFNNAPIKVFNENKVLSDPKLSKQFETAKNLIEGWRKGEYLISEVFDVELLSSFVALTNLYGGYHGLIWHNIRIYYNPITNKLEPVSFDSNSGTTIDKILQFPLSENDSIYQKSLRMKLKEVSSSAYVIDMMKRYSTEFLTLKKSLFTEYPETFDSSILEHNSNFIKKTLNPAVIITSELLSYNEKKISLAINNLSAYPVYIDKLVDVKGRSLSLKKTSFIEAGKKEIIEFELSKYFANAFVSKKNKKGSFQYPKDLKKLRVLHFIEGINVAKEAPITPYATNPNIEETIIAYKKSNTQNINQFPFISKKSDSVLIFSTGQHTLEKNLIIPSGYVVKIAPGFSLDFKNNSAIKSESSFICTGTLEKPIKFYSSDGTGQGIFITGAFKKSEVTYTHFDNLSNPQSDVWSVSGAVNFHESDVTISHSSFTNNRCEDALNIIRSEFTMTDTIFENTQSDAFDGDFVNGTLQRCTFINSGNDGIDVSGSTLMLKDIAVNNPSDKGISAGENSTISGDNITITGGEIGIVSKDLSTVQLNNVSITDTRLGFSAFQKKSEYGVASIDVNKLALKNIEVAHLIEVNSRLTIDTIAVKTVSNNVIDQMYGKEYGKSSR